MMKRGEESLMIVILVCDIGEDVAKRQEGGLRQAGRETTDTEDYLGGTRKRYRSMSVRELR